MTDDGNPGIVKGNPIVGAPYAESRHNPPRVAMRRMKMSKKNFSSNKVVKNKIDKSTGETRIYYIDSDGKPHQLLCKNGVWHAHDNVSEYKDDDGSWDAGHRDLTEEEEKIVEMCNERLKEGNS